MKNSKQAPQLRTMRLFLLLLGCLVSPVYSRDHVEIEMEEKLSGLGVVTDIQNAGDERLFIVDRVGTIQAFEKDTNGDFPTDGTTFLDITDRVLAGGERGLLGLAFHPNFATNRYFFVNYISRANSSTYISRFTATSDGLSGDPDSELVLAEIAQPQGNHNGGQLQFKNGFLYIGTGDGGGGNDPNQNGQSLSTLLGKILRVDVDNLSSDGNLPLWSIPDDNPFVGTLSSPYDAIWAYGLRNPWRFSFDRLTGDMWIGDVGQGAIEEVDFQPFDSTGGENYGWGFCEGTRFNSEYGISLPTECSSCVDATCYVSPVLEYDRSQATSVTGGYVYRGIEYAELIDGIYFHADYGRGNLWGAVLQEGNVITAGDVLSQPTTFGQDNNGELYVGTGNGNVLRLKATMAPTVSPAPSLPPGSTAPSLSPTSEGARTTIKLQALGLLELFFLMVAAQMLL